MTQHGTFIWIKLMTPNMEAATRFYGHVIGWQAKDYGSPDMPYTILEADGRGMGGIMELTEAHRADGIPPNWTRYVSVDDVDACARLYEEKGGRILRQPSDIPEIGRFAVVADPQGAVLCIMTPVSMETGEFPADSAALPGHVGWNELMTDNIDDAMAFYGDLFGWTLDHDFPMDGMGAYRIFAHGGKAIGGMMKRPAEVPVVHWGYYFNVDGIEDGLARVSAGGGKRVHGPMQVPGDSWIVTCQDPQGAYFSLVSQKK